MVVRMRINMQLHARLNFDPNHSAHAYNLKKPRGNKIKLETS